MICQNCLKSDAKVSVTEVELVQPEVQSGPGAAEATSAFDESMMGSSLPLPLVSPANAQAATPSASAPATPEDTSTLSKPSDATRDPSRQAYKATEHYFCKACADTMNLPHNAVEKKAGPNIWKLLQHSSQQTRKKGGPVCPDCGLTLDEFRKKGRLGCPKDYEVFHQAIGDLLERVHGARTHVGRVPGATDEDMERLQRVHEIKSRLETAIREEAYESAARLRDELKTLGEATPRDEESGSNA